VEAIANYAKAVWAAFPDVTFELVGVREIATGQVAREWLMRGTNSFAQENRSIWHRATDIELHDRFNFKKMVNYGISLASIRIGTSREEHPGLLLSVPEFRQ
jgi:hypothetical protein